MRETNNIVVYNRDHHVLVDKVFLHTNISYQIYVYNSTR